MTFVVIKVFDSHALYHELRKDTGGIASWILPLVLGGHLDHIHYIRGEKSYQMADGEFNLEVGTVDEHDPETGILLLFLQKTFLYIIFYKSKTKFTISKFCNVTNCYFCNMSI